MPGDNCCVFGVAQVGPKEWKYGSYRTQKTRTTRKCKEDWLGEITKTRKVDRDFKRQVENDKVFTREKNFHSEDIKTCK